MKKFTALLLAVFVLALSGCTDAPKNPSIKEAAEKVNFEMFSEGAPENTNFAIVVNPSDEQKKSLKVTSSLTLSEGDDEIYILPKKDGSKLDFYTASLDIISVNIEKGELAATETLDANECLLLTALIPEGMPSHLVTLSAPDADLVNYIISYDGVGEENVYYK